MTKVYVVTEPSRRIVANHVVEEGYSQSLTNDTLLPHIDIIFQTCASRLKLGHTGTLTPEI